MCVLYKSAAHLKLNATFNFARLGPTKTFKTCMLTLKDWRAHAHKCPPPTPCSPELPRITARCSRCYKPRTSQRTPRNTRTRQVHGLMTANCAVAESPKATITQRVSLGWGTCCTADHKTWGDPSASPNLYLIPHKHLYFYRAANTNSTLCSLT